MPCHGAECAKGELGQAAPVTADTLSLVSPLASLGECEMSNLTGANEKRPVLRIDAKLESREHDKGIRIPVLYSRYTYGARATWLLSI